MNPNNPNNAQAATDPEYAALFKAALQGVAHSACQAAQANAAPMAQASTAASSLASNTAAATDDPAVVAATGSSMAASKEPATRVVQSAKSSFRC